MPSIEENLGRIADALERIAEVITPTTAARLVDGVEHIPTMTAPPLAWFDAGHGCAVAVPAEAQGDAAWIQQLAAEEAQETADRESAHVTGQTTWDWLGITPPATRTRPKMPTASDPTADGRAEAGRKRRGRPLKCGRCRREGRSRMNHSNRCVECQHEEWWDE